MVGLGGRRIAVLLALGGCAAPAADRGPTTLPGDGGNGPVLRVDGEAVMLGQAATSLQLRTFVMRVQARGAASQGEEAGELVRTHPDLAERALFSREVSPETQETIALWLDDAAAPLRGGWSLLVADRASDPDRYAAWEAQREAAWSAFRRGGFAEVVRMDFALPEGGATPWPSADATSLRAAAMLASGRPADAAGLFARASELTEEWDARYAMRSRLFEVLGHRLAGAFGAAALAREAAVQGATLGEIDDPMVLRLLLETEEEGAAATTGFSRRQVRARLGRVEMQRGAPQAALLAWRKAETEPGSSPSRDRVRLGQAEALVALGQEQPAIAMLAGLAGGDLRSEALAMLGLVQLRRGQGDLALAVLREAVETTTPEANPGVYADAGLALLSTGDTERGLSLLHRARDEFSARGDMAALRRLLMNELRYAEAVQDSGLSSDVRQRLIGTHP
ncbi:MAG: tetratricopeptide repeat protein [Planctomycetota bacterium]